MNPTILADVFMAGTVGLVLSLLIFISLALFFAQDFLVRIWTKTSKKLAIALILGYAVIAMAAVTQTDLTTQVKNILPSANGGTGSAYFAISGPTALRTFTLPDANATILTSNTAVTVPQGGTGVASATAHGVMLGEGTSAEATTAVGATGNCFMGNTGADPSFQTCPSSTNLYQETPSGTINGLNTSFTLAHTPTASTNVNLFMNGVQQQQGAGNDYTISSATITYLTAPPTGSKLVALYF
jgi:hypothetical protein